MPRQPKISPSRFSNLRQRFSRFGRGGVSRTTGFMSRRPLLSFILALLLLLALIALGNFIGRPATNQETKQPAPKTVQVYNIGQAPKVTLQAQVQKSGVISIVAQAGGIVNHLKFREGDSVKKGQVLVGLATNYQGGNAMSASRALAQKQNQLTRETYADQKTLIDKQREVANKSETSASELREIGRQANNDTSATIGLNQDILNTLNQNLAQYEASNSGGVNSQLIFQTKQMASQYQAAILQLRTMQRQSDYGNNEDNIPAQLSQLQRDIALKQLDVQEKSLAINKEISQLQLNLAYINESLMYPVAPGDGVVQQVHVRQGQSVAPGTPLVTLSTNNGHISAVAKVPAHIARAVSGLEPSTLIIGDQRVSAYPSYVSTEATDGQLYAVNFDIPDEYASQLSDKGFISLEVPVGSVNTSATIPFVPLDSVFQTQTETYLYVVENNQAHSRPVKLGSVLGRFVEITEGLQPGDQIILNRNVISGEAVTTNQ